jgi:hypothetical protein
MLIYDYQCGDCSEREQRVAGLDDHTALCVACGGLMLRVDVDVFQPYFEPRPPAGYDGLCLIDCKAYDPQSAYCREQGE